ncbi:MAG: glycosyltransferase [Myxococcota bacterium]
MRVLVTTKLFPNEQFPDLAPFNRFLFRELNRLCTVDVYGLQPWLPGARFVREDARRRSAVPRRAKVDGLSVEFPRVLYGPGPARFLSGALVTASLAPRILPRQGRWDIVVGSFAYPDGFAGLLLARALGVPIVIKIHGSDIHLFKDDPLIAPILRWLLPRTDALVGPSHALVDDAIALGAPAARAITLRNGVDTKRFRPRDRMEVRQRLGRPSERLQFVFVGRLDERKGLFDLLEAFRSVAGPDRELVLVGDGRDRARAEAFVAAHTLPVTFVGRVEPEAVADHVAAADALVLPSWAEGTPNVILEALAAGRRVIGTDVGGIPAALPDPLLGEVVPVRDPRALGQALARIDRNYDPEAVRAASGTFDWKTCAAQFYDVLHETWANARAGGL